MVHVNKAVGEDLKVQFLKLNDELSRDFAGLMEKTMQFVLFRQ